MKKFQAKDLARNTADLWTAANVAPVAITKHRKARFAVMSVERFSPAAGCGRIPKLVKGGSKR